MIAHMIGETRTERDGCSVVELHPQAVRAARNRLVSAPPAERVAALFALLADPTRARLLTALGDAELCVCDLAVATGVNRTTVSHALRALREAGLVRRRRSGKVVYYGLADDHVAALLAMGLAHAAEEPSTDEPATGEVTAHGPVARRATVKVVAAGQGR